MPYYNRTEERIKNVLQDGQEHEVSKLMACMNDELTGRNILHQHVFSLRRKLETVGRTVVRKRVGDKTTYRMVQFIDTDNDD